MTRIILTASFILLYSFTFSQKYTYYNEFFYPVEFNKKSPPSYYSESELIEKFKNEKIYALEDSSLIRTKRIEVNSEGNKLSEVTSYYDSEGKLTQELQFDKDRNNRILRKFDGNGKITRQREFIKFESITDVYFDKNGSEIEKLSELQPEPYKGFNAWYKYLMQNIKYPKEALVGGVKSDVLIYFTVSEQGKIEAIEILNPEEVHFYFAEVAYKLVKNYPHDWNPYILNGETLKKEVIFPIVFNPMIFK
jgi:hypothetical protein